MQPRVDPLGPRQVCSTNAARINVKNLENVQGDERDVIFISLGWGRTPEGALHQRFYPVNRREDGHRRLNVLFTRAKRKVVVFASLEAEDILVDAEKSAAGVRILRD